MQFLVNAIDARREVVALDLKAASEAAAAEAARGRGLTVLSVRSRGVAGTWLRSRAATFPLTLFSVELMALLEAGLNLVEALQTLTEKEARSECKAVLTGIVAAIRRGEPFSQAVANFPQHFPPLYVATLKAAEQTGNVAEALTRYVAYQGELDRVRKKVVAATIYPAILSIVGTLVLGFLVFYVVPRFARVYEDMSGKLPFFSEMLNLLGRTVHEHGFMIGATCVTLLALAAYSATHEAFRAWINLRLWQVPGLGGQMKVYQLARLYRTVGMLMRAGIPAVRSLDMVRDLLAAHLRPHLAQARRLIEEGRLMSAAFMTAGLATPVAARMMAVGERTGDMGEMMGRIASFHDEEISRNIDWFTRIFEPVLMAVLGIAVGGVVVVMYMPIFELAGSIQ
jgi:general secretion pathway protein F